MMRWLGTLVVLAHFVISLFHGSAHTKLHVELSAWQQSYVLIVIIAAPLVAAPLIWTRLSRFGFILLVAAMAGALIFGAYFHFFAISPDHVTHLPPGDARGLFRVTSVLLAITEVFGITVGQLGLRKTKSRLQNRS
jgi:hypothetical protein